jgi:hypothetical protein
MNLLNKIKRKLLVFKITGKNHCNFDILFLFIIISISSTNILSQDCESEIIIKTNNEYSLIYLNGRPIGSGNVEINIKKGTYPVLLKENKFGWDSEEIKDTIVIDGCNETKEFSYQFKKNIFINSKPQDAGVYYADSLIGYTPLVTPLIYSDLIIMRDEYQQKKFIINFNDHYKDINLSYLGHKSNKNFLETDLFKLLIGTAVLFGGTSAYYKLKADDYFDQYNNTNIQSYLDKTHNYDTISGILFGALQLNFAALIYFFLTD